MNPQNSQLSISRSEGMRKAVGAILIGCWALASWTLRGAEEPKLKITTYNVFANPEAADRRVPKIMDLLKQSQSDVIALQEVAPWFLKRLHKEDWVAKRYLSPTLNDGCPGGLFLISKWPIQKTSIKALPSRNGRGVLVADLLIQEQKIRIAVIHLESPLDAHDMRDRQLAVCLELLKDSKHAVLMGDFNFGDGEKPECERIKNQFKDPWLTLHPKRPGFTWDIEKSGMARKGSFKGEKSRRLDRILMRSNVWEPKSIRIIGTNPVKEGELDLFPSDHFGLTAVFHLKKKVEK